MKGAPESFRRENTLRYARPQVCASTAEPFGRESYLRYARRLGEHCRIDPARISFRSHACGLREHSRSLAAARRHESLNRGRRKVRLWNSHAQSASIAQRRGADRRGCAIMRRRTSQSHNHPRSCTALGDSPNWLSALRFSARILDRCCRDSPISDSRSPIPDPRCSVRRAAINDQRPYYHAMFDFEGGEHRCNTDGLVGLAGG